MTALFFCILLVFGCNTSNYPGTNDDKPDGNIGRKNSVVWHITLEWIDPYPYEFRDELIRKTAVFSDRSELYEYLEQNASKGKGILVLSKIFQTLSDEEKRNQVEEVVKHLDKYGYHLFGVQLQSSDRSHQKIYSYHELPFVKTK